MMLLTEFWGMGVRFECLEEDFGPSKDRAWAVAPHSF